MRESDSLLPVVFAVVTGFTIVAMVILSGQTVSAGENSPESGVLKCLPMSVQKCAMAVKATTTHRKTIGAQRAELNTGDQLAVLRSVQYALSNVGDGGTYVWHRRNGRISSVVRPTESFMDGSGRVCRHVLVKFSAGDFSRSTETVACRRESGVWDLSG